jgi:alpha-mannosidase
MEDRMRVISTLCAGLAMTLGGLTGAPAVAKEKLADAAIMAGDYIGAERVLVDQRRSYTQLPEVMLNLAFVYAQTGRQAEAMALYRQVLRQPEVELDNRLGQSFSSHDLAKVGLSRLTLALR